MMANKKETGDASNRARPPTGLRPVSEPPVFFGGFDDLAMIRDPVEQSRRYLRAAEHIRPLSERERHRYDNRRI